MTTSAALTKNPFSEFDGMAELTKLFEKLLNKDLGACQLARRLAVIRRMPLNPRLLKGNVTLIALWNGHEFPDTAIPATQKMLKESSAQTLILSGGRIYEHWQPDQTEADMFHERLTRYNFNIAANVLIERRAMHTHAQFANIKDAFPETLLASDHIVILAHRLQTNRALMDARNVFCADGFMSPETFECKMHVQGYDALKPKLDPTSRHNLAETLSRFVTYTEKGDLTPLPAEWQTINRLRQRALALKAA